jgi:hypothetical protein
MFKAPCWGGTVLVLVLVFFETGSLRSSDWPGACYIDKAGRQLVKIHLPLLPRCWDLRCTHSMLQVVLRQIMWAHMHIHDFMVNNKGAQWRPTEPVPVLWSLRVSALSHLSTPFSIFLVTWKQILPDYRKTWMEAIQHSGWLKFTPS